jgi:hypothetical protein
MEKAFRGAESGFQRIEKALRGAKSEIQRMEKAFRGAESGLQRMEKAFRGAESGFQRIEKALRGAEAGDRLAPGGRLPARDPLKKILQIFSQPPQETEGGDRFVSVETNARTRSSLHADSNIRSKRTSPRGICPIPSHSSSTTAASVRS